MRILLIHRYFWPDTPPYAAMLRSIGRKLADDGHEVVVLSSQPSYKLGVTLRKQPVVENVDGLKIHRVALLRERDRHVVCRLINMIYFSLWIFLFSLLKGKFDVIMASTAPPVVVGFSAAIGARMTGASFFYHCMDIHPEIGQISGEFRNPLVFKFLRILDMVSCRIANRVIVLSEDMRQSLLERPGYYKANISVINNFSMPSHCGAIEGASELLKQPDRFRVLFAGNIGRFQGLEVFVDAMKKLVHRSMIELVFVGEGNALSMLVKRANGAGNVIFLPHQSVNIARGIIADADLGIVSLNKGIYRYAYPSKTMTYLDEGCPLLVSVEADSELANFVRSSGLGILVTPDQSQSIADAIELVYLDRDRHQRMQASAKKISNEIFSERIVIKKWASLFDSVAGDRDA